jgi:hypothetical protein
VRLNRFRYLLKQKRLPSFRDPKRAVGYLIKYAEGRESPTGVTPSSVLTTPFHRIPSQLASVQKGPLFITKKGQGGSKVAKATPSCQEAAEVAEKRGVSQRPLASPGEYRRRGRGG